MSIETVFVFRAERFRIGQDTESRKYVLAIAMGQGAVEYDEYYELTDEEFARFSRNLAEMRELAEECRRQRQDHRRLVAPGSQL
jgi:hypothetical protein